MAKVIHWPRSFFHSFHINVKCVIQRKMLKKLGIEMFVIKMLNELGLHIWSKTLVEKKIGVGVSHQ